MRRSGILMHLSSIPSPHGIGTMGQAAREFVDFLKESGQSVWQLLPIGPTSYGDSPYQSYSTFAGNPYFIDLDELRKMGILSAEDYEGTDWECSEERVNYGALYFKRYPILQRAAENFLKAPTEAYADFCLEHKGWLDDFALFMTLKDIHGGKGWTDWDEGYRNRDEGALAYALDVYQEKIQIWKVYQFFFYKQWRALKAYANERGVEILGDLPIYVSMDSVDVWAHPELFQLDEERRPQVVAGCPPDAFSEDGQLWGNPLYAWDVMEKDQYRWWTERIRHACDVFDILRIDHFRGFESYYAIPAGDRTARNGKWCKGPGMKLFHAVESALGKKNIIAEDLGYLTKEVRDLLRDSGFPGMKVLEFAFDEYDTGRNEYLPHNHVQNAVAYLGTHDNNTVVGWYRELSDGQRRYVNEYLRLGSGELHWEFIQSLFSSVAELVIVQMQDILGLDESARMNMPSTSGCNWSWRARKDYFTQELAEKLRRNTLIYGRLEKC